MLQADKRVLLADVKKEALELSQKELEFNVERYTNLATQASVLAGFSFESLVELEIPEEFDNEFISSLYFVFGASAMSLSLYVLCVSSFACVYGHRLALQGPHGSLERAVKIMIDHRDHVFNSAAVALFCLVMAAILMSWIKMGKAAGLVSSIFLSFFGVVAFRMNRMSYLFEIPEHELVSGSTHVYSHTRPGAAIALSQLNPGDPSCSAGSPVAHSSYDSGGYTRLNDEVQREASRPSPQRESSCYTSAEESSTGKMSVATSPSQRGPCAKEGYLFKKPGNSSMSHQMSLDSTRRRWFVLTGSKVLYFKSWEEYGSGGSAINRKNPIDMLHYVASSPSYAASESRIQLIPKHHSPSTRTFELQASTAEDAANWLEAFQTAEKIAEEEAMLGRRGGPRTQRAYSGQL